VNLANANNKVDATMVGGFYDSTTKRIVLRAGRLDVAGRVALAHELTHALQDQHFGISRIYRKAERTGSFEAAQALIEGDAVWVESEYLVGLPTAERTAYERRFGSVLGGSAAAATDVPQLLSVRFDLPYALGPLMRVFVQETKGPRAVDDLFRHPPRSDADYITLSRLVADLPVSYPQVPRLNAGEVFVDATYVGPSALFEILASRLDATVALDATDEWYGGVALTYTRGSTTCVRTSFATPTNASAAALGNALVAWAATMPAGTASARRLPLTWTLDTCDPGAAARLHPNSLAAAEETLVIRNSLLVTAVARGRSVPLATCMADRALRDTRLRAIIDNPDTDTTSRAQHATDLQTLFFRDAAQACGDRT